MQLDNKMISSFSNFKIQMKMNCVCKVRSIWIELFVFLNINTHNFEYEKHIKSISFWFERFAIGTRMTGSRNNAISDNISLEIVELHFYSQKNEIFSCFYQHKNHKTKIFQQNSRKCCSFLLISMVKCRISITDRRRFEIRHWWLHLSTCRVAAIGFSFSQCLVRTTTHTSRSVISFTNLKPGGLKVIFSWEKEKRKAKWSE